MTSGGGSRKLLDHTPSASGGVVACLRYLCIVLCRTLFNSEWINDQFMIVATFVNLMKVKLPMDTSPTDLHNFAKLSAFLNI